MLRSSESKENSKCIILFLSSTSTILASNGSSQPVVTSQWLSRNTSIFPLADLTPAILALISPTMSTGSVS